MMGKKKDPPVSVALATYNGEKYLGELLHSLAGQTYANLEVVMCDDGSTDSTIAILRDYASRYPNFKLHTYAENVGYVKNFERAFGHCLGDYIAPCDQDDVWLPHKVQRLVDEIGDYPLLISDSIIVDQALEDTGKKISDAIVCRDIGNCLSFTLRTNVYGHTCLFTKELLQRCAGFHSTVSYDSWLGFQATLCGGTKFLNEPLTFYRQHDSNVASITGRKKPKHLKQKPDVQRNNEIARTRVNLYYEACPAHLTKEKEVLLRLKKSYADFSLRNNVLRVITFLQNYRLLLAVKKKSSLGKFLFSLKMFGKIQ